MSSSGPPASMYDVVIVGAGHAGAQAAASLRQRRFEGSVAMIGDEPDPPYERPPLSKAYLSGEKSFDEILIRPENFWLERDVILRLGTAVVAVDPVSHHLVLADGERVGYGALIWATGGRPRRLGCEGADLRGVHAVRTRSEIDRLLSELPNASRVVVVGGGYIGLEAAAALTKLGKAVVVLENQDRVLARVAGEPLSRFFEAEHRAHGVDVRLEASVERLEGHDGAVVGVRLGHGARLACEIVIVGIGIVPAVEPLLAAGAAGQNGVLVDDHCRTSLPDVFAVGDCAEHQNRYAGGRRIRLESVQNANDQARVVAHGLTGGAAAYDAVPWFWSDQYDLKLQTVGLSGGHDAAIVRGDPATRSFSVVYLRQGRVIALDCVNAPRDYVQGRALVMAGARAQAAHLADLATPLKDLVLS